MTHSTMTSMDVSLPCGRALRVSLIRDQDGEPEMLSLVEGWSGPWRPDERRRLSLPGHLLPELAAALAALQHAEVPR
jgi:hypothetical protein